MTDTRDRRKAVRLALDIPIDYLGKEFMGKGTVVNASPYGLLIRGDYLPIIGTYVSLRLFPLHENGPLYVERAVVRWQTASELGVELITMSPEAHVRLTVLMNAALKQNGCTCAPSLPWLCRCLPVGK